MEITYLKIVVEGILKFLESLVSWLLHNLTTKAQVQ
jgi:hypothetical protein